MTRTLIARFASIALTALFVAQVHAQSSPWPFAPRSTPTSALATGVGKSVTVAFWNIQWFPGGRPDSTQAEQTLQTNMVQADIARLNPDILGMEEIRNFASAGLATKPLKGFGVDVRSEERRVGKECRS